MSARITLPDVPVAIDVIARANETFAADQRADKINLGIGVYIDGTGAVPLMRAVREAERRLFDEGIAHRYLPIAGLTAFNARVQDLVLGPEAPVDGRACTVQALGGTGALALAAALLRQWRGDAQVLISDPSWENHRAIFEAAGFRVGTYPYYDDATHAVRFDALLDALTVAAPGTIVVLHVCCHNPTGMDLSEAQWQRVIDVLERNDLLPVCDLAYQGFGRGLADDRAVVGWMLARGLDVLVAHSLSKSFSLYGERVGALTVVTSSGGETAQVAKRLQRIVRSSYSNPPTHGAALADVVLGSTALRATWEEELDAMRVRIQRMRTELCARLVQHAPSVDMAFIASQSGMFSYTGLSAHQVSTLNADHAIHLLPTGRLCVAALTDDNLDRVADAIGRVLSAG